MVHPKHQITHAKKLLDCPCQSNLSYQQCCQPFLELLPIADGSISMADGSISMADGSISMADGSISMADGSSSMANNSTTATPESAEQLMRSRYCAYVFKNENYLLKTWHPDYRPNSLNLDSSPNQWIGLKIKQVQAGTKADTTGQVHFIARYKINGKAYKLEENSQFVKIKGQWFYL